MLKAWFKIAILKRQRKQAARHVNDLQRRLRSEGVSDEEAAVPIVAAAREIERIDAEIGLIRTARLNLKAIRLGIDLPPTEWLYTRHVQYANHTQQVSTLTQ